MYDNSYSATVHFPPWSHANNNRQWGITLSQHTVPTWLLVIPVRGTHINDTNTSPVWKQWKVLRNSQQNTANGNLAHWEPHSTGTDQVRVWTEASLLPSSSTLQQVEEVEHCETIEQTIKAFWPEMFKAKAQTELSPDKEQQLWRVLAQQEHERVGFTLQTELTFIYIT